MIYIICTIFIVLLGLFIKPKKSQKRKAFFISISFFILMLLAALRKYTIGIDLKILYYPNFLKLYNTSFQNLSKFNLEMGYLIFAKTISVFFSHPQSYIIVTSIIIYSIYGLFIYKNSETPFESTLLFIIMNNYFMSMNIVRQELAVSLILIGYEYLKKNKNIIFIFLVLLATLFHQSSLVCLLFLLFKNRRFEKKHITYAAIILIACLLFYSNIINIFTYILAFFHLNFNKDYTFYFTSKHGLSIINLNSISSVLLSLGFFIVVYYFFIVMNSVSEEKKTVDHSHFLTYMTMFYTIITVVSIKMYAISRLSEFFMPFVLISVPQAINSSKSKNNKFIINFIMYSCIIAKHLYILFCLADILYGTSPYLFFWQ